MDLEVTLTTETQGMVLDTISSRSMSVAEGYNLLTESTRGNLADQRIDTDNSINRKSSDYQKLKPTSSTETRINNSTVLPQIQ